MRPFRSVFHALPPCCKRLITLETSTASVWTMSSSRHYVSVCVAKVIPVYDDVSDLLSVVLEETGGLGVDIVIDSGGRHFSHNRTLNETQIKTSNLLIF